MMISDASLQTELTEGHTTQAVALIMFSALGSGHDPTLWRKRTRMKGRKARSSKLGFEAHPLTKRQSPKDNQKVQGGDICSYGGTPSSFLLTSIHWAPWNIIKESTFGERWVEQWRPHCSSRRPQWHVSNIYTSHTNLTFQCAHLRRSIKIVDGRSPLAYRKSL